MGRGTYIRTPEMLLLQSLVQRGKKHAPFSEETRKKMSIAALGNQKGKALTGKPKSEAHKQKIRERRREQKMQRGKHHWKWKGGPSSCIDCKKEFDQYYPKPMRCRPCRQVWGVGENHPSFKPNKVRGYPVAFNAQLKLKIRERDNFLCCLCFRTEEEEKAEFGRALTVNHIDWDRSNNSEDNLNTLCLRCNVNINQNKPFWSKHFALQHEWAAINAGRLF